jgi:hypothetical protein
MTRRLALVFLACTFLAACNSLEGTFEPACIAFEGDKVVFADGRFEWHKFTDERLVDDNGNAIDPFPGYPLTGRYKVSNALVEFVAAEGAGPDDMFLFERNSDVYLLTRKQNDAVLAGEGLPACPLRLNATKSPN